jgi:hypothetical protein
MNQEIRNKLRNVVTHCRKLLEDSVSRELEGKYGIFAKKEQVTADPNAKMSHLTEEEQAARKDILDHLGHVKARGFKPKEALDQLVREIAFTHLNRLCAYKMMEAREVYVGGQKFREAVSRGINSNGVKFYLAGHPDEERLFNTGHQDTAYRHFLDWLGGLLSDEIGVLFNPNDPANRLYPRQKTVDELLDLLNGGGIKPEETELREEWPKIWSQDETIGWVYQYFTPKELRDQARKESAAPRNSYELAFRNQFFTPRYVVEFLTDNTLGRIWFEMHKGDTKLKDQCQYMVRRPTEHFLKDGEQPPKDATEGRNDLSQEELLKVPVYIPHRPKKDPRELRILDPASGSGHFLLYCFDLLLTIYDEAYADTELGPALLKDYPKLEDLRRDVPRLILAHNVHGIDIDLRASQIAALALWLRCQRAYQEMGLKKDRPKITRSNFVCAEPMPGEGQILKEFVGQLEPKLLGQVVEVVFDKMKLAGEAGTLLKIEEEIRGAVAEAKKQWVRETTLATDRKGESLLFTQAAMDRMAGKPQQSSIFDLTDITDDQFFDVAEAQVVDALHKYAQKAQNGQRLQRRLFTDDAERGFAFVDLCHKQYDVVLMNPPFGLSTDAVFRQLEKESPDTYVEIYASFVSRGITLARSGYVGAITSRGFMMMTRLTAWRTNTVLPHLSLLLDLGLGVMDEAYVQSCAYILSGSANSLSVSALDLRDSKNPANDSISANWRAGRDSWFHIADKRRLASLPESRLLYAVSPVFAEFLTISNRFEPDVGTVRKGLTTFDDFRFLRLAWEVSPSTIGKGIHWERYAKGGEFARYYSDIHLLVNRLNGGEELAEVNRRVNGQEAQSRQGSKYYYRPGAFYTSRSAKGFSARVLPSDCVMSSNSPAILSESEIPSAYLLGWVNSRLIRTAIEFQSHFSDYVPGVLKGMAWKPPSKAAIQETVRHVHALIDSYRSLASLQETDPYFAGLTAFGSLALRTDESLENVRAIESTIRTLQKAISKLVDEQYGFDSSQQATDVMGDSPDEEVTIEVPTKLQLGQCVVSYAVGCLIGRWDIRFTIAQTQLPLPDPFVKLPACSPGMLQDEHGLPMDSAPDGYPLRVNWDGILVDDPDHPDDIAQRARHVIEVIWKNQAEALEKEACGILGVKEIRDYFRKPSKGGFWDDHVARYSKSRRKAPIYWLLQSAKKNYALWLYYLRFDKDLLFKALVNYVEPKIRMESSRLETFRSKKAVAGDSGKEAKRLAKEVEQQEDFISELRDFEDKLRRAANQHLVPDLNDGVVLNIAPLWELVPWKEAEEYWEELLAGKYEWSSIGKQLRQKGLVK